MGLGKLPVSSVHRSVADRQRLDADPVPDPDTVLPQVLHMLETQKMFCTCSAGLHFFYLSHQRHNCNNFLYFGQYIEIFWKKSTRIVQLFSFG